MEGNSETLLCGDTQLCNGLVLDVSRLRLSIDGELGIFFVVENPGARSVD